MNILNRETSFRTNSAKIDLSALFEFVPRDEFNYPQEWDQLPEMPIDESDDRPQAANVYENMLVSQQFGNSLQILHKAPWKPVTQLEVFYANEYFIKSLEENGVPPWKPVYPLEKMSCHEYYSAKSQTTHA